MRQKKNGFTVIEVTLVIAIGGLIFLMALVAVPALRRSQRDTSRREAVMKLVSEIKNYQTNNARGELPGSSNTQSISDSTMAEAWGSHVGEWSAEKNTSIRGFYRDYLGDDFVDPNGKSYNLFVGRCGTDIPENSCINEKYKNVLSKVESGTYTEIMMVLYGSVCYGDKQVASSNPRNFSVLYKLEGSGYYCSGT